MQRLGAQPNWLGPLLIYFLNCSRNMRLLPKEHGAAKVEKTDLTNCTSVYTQLDMVTLHVSRYLPIMNRHSQYLFVLNYSKTLY